MTNKEFYREFGNIDPKMIEAAAPAEKVQKKKKNGWVTWASMAACFLLIVSVILAVPMLREDDPGVIPGPGTTDDPGVDTPPNGTTNNDNPGNIRPLHWDDVSSFFGASGTSGNDGNPAEMYEKVFYEITSGVYSNYKDGSIISDDCVGEKIDTVVIRTGWYQSWNDEERDVFEVNAEVYQIKGIDSMVAIAIKYLEKPQEQDPIEYFYVYSNPYGCDAASLTEFFEAYGADKYMNVFWNAHIREFNEGSSTNFAIYNINKDALDTIDTQILNLVSTVSYSRYTDSDIKEIENITNACKERLQISVEIKSAGRYGVVYILDNGYICFTGFGDFFALHSIGSDAAQALIETVKNNSVCINPSVDENWVVFEVKDNATTDSESISGKRFPIEMTIAETLPSCVAFEYKDGEPYCFYGYDDDGKLYRVLWNNFDGLNEKDRIVVDHNDVIKTLSYDEYPDGGWTPQYEVTAISIYSEAEWNSFQQDE